MKKLISVFLLLMIIIFSGCNQTENNNKKLTIYAYDSLTAEWGLMPQILEKFETENNIEAEIVSFADTGAMLNQLILEKGSPKADLVIGLDNVDFYNIESEKLFTSYKPRRADEIKTDLLFSEDYSLIPFDYGYIGFVYDSEQISFDDPVSLKDLASEKYKDKIIIEQAGLSSPGTQLLLWTKAALDKEEYTQFWQDMAENILTVAPDWSTAYYSMFMEGEAPIVLSYLTSPAYHIDQEKINKYKAIPIKEGYIRQIEGMGLINNSNNQELGQKFIDYILTDEVQNKIPTTQWMFPVLRDKTSWPEAYSQIIIPEDNEVLSINSDELKNYKTWLKDWNDIFGI